MLRKELFCDSYVANKSSFAYDLLYLSVENFRVMITAGGAENR